MPVNSHSRPTAHDDRDPRLAQLYHECAQETPPPRLDAEIRAAARRAVGSRPGFGRLRLHSWRLPVAIAAVIVLSVSMVTLVMERGQDQGFIQTPGSLPPLEPAQKSTTDGPRTGGPESLPEESVLPKPVPKTADAARAPAVSALKPPKSSIPVPPPAPPTHDTRERSTARVEAPATAASERPAGAPMPPGPAPHANASGAEIGSGQTALTQQQEPEKAGSAGTIAKPLERGRGAKTGSQEEPAKKQELDSGTASVLRDGGLPAPGRLDTRRQDAGAVGLSEASSRAGTLIREYQNRPPEKWLEKIVELRRQGDDSAAMDMLLEFKKRFPAYPLPPELR